jgi:hypothetical protein
MISRDVDLFTKTAMTYYMKHELLQQFLPSELKVADSLSEKHFP